MVEPTFRKLRLARLRHVERNEVLFIHLQVLGRGVNAVWVFLHQQSINTTVNTIMLSCSVDMPLAGVDSTKPLSLILVG